MVTGINYFVHFLYMHIVIISMSLKSYHVKRFNPSVKRFTVSTALLWFQGGYNTPGTYMGIN